MDSAFVAIVPTRPCPLFGRPVHRQDGSYRFRPGVSPQALRIPPRGGHPALLDLPRGQRGITPAFGYGAPHPNTSGTSTHLSTSLPSAHYWSVRLPRSVRHRRTSLDFPMRPQATAALGELGISRFPSEVSVYVHGVSDRAGLWHTSRYRCIRWGLPLLLTASASRRKLLTRLNTRPAHSPVNASTLPLRAAPHDSGPMWVGRVRWWRGSGLRMMPTFPPPPLSFRTAGFPQYGWKVGLSGSAFPRVAQVKPAPGMPCAACRFASAFRALRCLASRSALCRNLEPGGAPPCEELSPLPQRPSLRSGFYCPSPSTLIRPHPSHSRAHPDFAGTAVYTGCLRCACSSMPRRPTTGSELSLMVFRNMSSSETTGNSSAALAQYFTENSGLQLGIKVSAFPSSSHSDSGEVCVFEA